MQESNIFLIQMFLATNIMYSCGHICFSEFLNTICMIYYVKVFNDGLLAVLASVKRHGPMSPLPPHHLFFPVLLFVLMFLSNYTLLPVHLNSHW